VPDQAAQRRRHALDGALARRRLLAASEHDQVAALGLVETQGARQRLEHVQGGAHIASLLEPRVPGGTHPRELRNLLTAQTRRAPPATVGKADVLWSERLAAMAQEVGELLAAPLAGVSDLTKEPLAVVSVFGKRRCGHLFYQDKPFSTTRITSV